MANHKSAKKRIRQTLRKRQVNKQVQSLLRTLEKNLRQLIEKQDKSKAQQQLKTLSAKMDSAVHKTGLHKNKVGRKKSRLTQLVNQIS